MFKMSFHDPFGILKHFCKSNWQFDSRSLKVENRLDFFVCRWRATYHWKILTRVTTLLDTSPQLEVFTQSYGPPKSWESQFREFRDSNLGVPRQNDIWMLASWPCTNNIIKEKVVASPKFRPWWVLWVCVCMWFIHAPKVFQLRTNQLIVWFVQVHVNKWLACHSS
jgi:hypothetical protein